jgi:hypothetical protein
MTSVTIRFSNSNAPAIYIQVDPWAGVYVLEQGQEIEFLAESEKNTPVFHIDEYDTTRILTILHSDEYFIIRDGKRVHWTEFQTNVKGQLA